jgi:GT2 family glycosyltransferase
LVDDLSEDKTSESVTRSYPEVQIIQGTGDLYWSGGMRLAMETAIEGSYSGFILLNDDVVLDPDALDRMLNLDAVIENRSLIGGSMRASDNSAEAAYGGNCKAGLSPFKFQLVQPDPLEIKQVSVLNGNLLYIPASVAQQVGNIAPYLKHQGGDFEYCLRARKHGIASVLAPGTYGVCSPNPARPKKRGFAGVKRMLCVKENPIDCNYSLYREHGGPFWQLWLLVPYIRAFIVGV